MVGMIKSQPQVNNPIQSAYNTASGATRQQAGDYDDILNRYRQLYTDWGNSGNDIRNAINTSSGGGSPVVPGYQTSAAYTDAINNLGGLAKNGGYSDQNIADIRERGISPIRAVYGNAQRDLQRQKSLQGGYSPNYAAISAKMAREMGSQLADQTTAVNAQIAQNVAQNRLAASTPYASTTLNEQEDRNNYNLKAAELAKQDQARISAGLLDSITLPLQGKQSALAGMTNLYGTTPAFAALTDQMANQQAAQQAQIQANNQAYNGRKLQAFGGY